MHFLLRRSNLQIENSYFFLGTLTLNPVDMECTAHQRVSGVGFQKCIVNFNYVINIANIYYESIRLT